MACASSFKGGSGGLLPALLYLLDRSVWRSCAHRSLSCIISTNVCENGLSLRVALYRLDVHGARPRTRAAFDALSSPLPFPSASASFFHWRTLSVSSRRKIRASPLHSASSSRPTFGSSSSVMLAITSGHTISTRFYTHIIRSPSSGN